MYTEENKMPYDERGRDDILDGIIARSGCSFGDGHSRSMKREGVEKSFSPSGFPIAMVYSPAQEWQDIYDTDTALARGTLFAELDLPFVCGEKGKGGGFCD